ncbi:amino acid dehydrogenase [Bradyrhizobium yuanmingense]|uniref:D-amino acid dehydrogenase n=1 Tax=Bradyrhizobium yuanmingense TaxID=108015 RepID=A0A0R3CSY3_9BRAD|nr:D-amino acid dehydrogenase [Bradyrhizobium yuanmingense]KRP98228.1 amino acid dehydrogenase [Bradyrhizobium yuanmingense]
MKVLILGSGVIGVTSAYYLARAGHEVTVVDRQPEPALETSFANAGEVSPGYSSPWAGPGVPVKAIKWLLMKHGPLVIRPKLDPVMWVWLLKMLRNCTSARYAVNKSRMIPIAEYSRDSLRDLRRDIGIQYDERSQGTLQLFRYQAQLDGTAEDIAVLKQYGVPFEVLNREGCIAVEPALAGVKEKFVGGLRLPQDETGDCHMFTQALARHAQALGVRFLFNTSIDRIVTDGARVSGVATSAGLLQADAYVLALGSWSSRLLAPLGISLPVYPVKGYSITVPIKDASGAPESTVMDESYKVAITRLGNRIRVGGTAEISGYSDKLYDARRATLDHSLTDLFPRGGDVSKATFWSGLRPMTPDGPPVIGRTHFANLHLNTGHGTLGWTMSCGSGRVLADMLSGKKPDIDVSALSVERYKHRFG